MKINENTFILAAFLTSLYPAQNKASTSAEALGLTMYHCLRKKAPSEIVRLRTVL